MDDCDGSRKFGESLVGLYEPGLKSLQKQLSELTTKQSVVLKDVEKENLKFASINTNELQAMFSMIKEYHSRVYYIKKEMIELADRSAKLKRRALRLQDMKQKEALEAAHYREAQLKREQDLVAKPDPNFKLP
ncbi:Pyroglutamyl-peptidase [Nesidiocoris tenuis]|uniref:Biogenesis of lysosome-related organelles complex 1 subunit 6 n=1 Tax=Nesidiocoris tenuis TaxID=355587 RepID=A0ABN7AYU0_9HEMI|nr:Pyroglutamyl-peptidase [Nesidiocoris tenuis]